MALGPVNLFKTGLWPTDLASLVLRGEFNAHSGPFEFDQKGQVHQLSKVL
jgi:hypothetical protein